MSNAGYDLDTSGGLMPLIKALIKPPDEELVAQKPKKPQHPYYKRPGKGHNHDSCDACGEGGDLICCDRCPASFHLGCYDPPLDENDIPAGLWLCKECHGSDENKAASSRSSRAQSPADSKSDTEKKTRTLRNHCSNSTKKKSKEDEEEVKNEPEPEKELSPMEILVKAAKIMNPTQFELPREMRIPCIFPGTEKEMGKNGNGSLVTTDAWGCVPLPAQLCFVCRGTCKQAPLLHCDYCPLHFHQDCLDPPLTALPTGRWMCPNHVEQYIDWKLVNSISATERVALWDRFAGPVDRLAVQLDFIRRARRENPPFRQKLCVGGRPRVAVPMMVRRMYHRRAPLLPSRREFVRCDAVLKRLKASGAYDSSSDEERPKRAICLNTECPQYSDTGACPLRGANGEDAEDDLHAINEPKVERHTDSSSDLSDSDFEYYTSTVKRRKVARAEDKGSTKRGRPERLELRADAHVEELLAAVDEQLGKLDERLVKLLAWQRLQQLLVGEQCAGLWRHSPLAARAHASVRRSVERTRLARLGLAGAGPGAPGRAPLPSELLSRRDRERIVAAVWGAPPVPPAPEPAPPPQSPADAAVRAVLAPLAETPRNGASWAARTVCMRRSALTVGADSGCDVRLDATACRRVSRRHAVIFMDEVSRHFELINYSEWGSCVNGVRYACDAGAAGEPADPPRPARGGPRSIRVNGDLTGPLRAEPWAGCGCGPAPGPAAGAWEGSALVPHGALLQFGCLAFVFCITDHQACSDDEPAL